MEEWEGDRRPERHGACSTRDTVQGNGGSVSEVAADGTAGTSEADDGGDVTEQGVDNGFHPY